MSVVDDIRLVDDGPDGQTLVIETETGTSQFTGHNLGELLDDALRDYRAHVAEGEAVRAERAAAGGVSYAEAMGRTDPDWVDALLEGGDLLRKRERENGPLVNRDTGDENDYRSAA